MTEETTKKIEKTENPEKIEKAADPIIFYCKDCSEVVKTDRIGNKYVYKCKKCGTKNVAFGTKKSIYTFFRLDDKEKKAEAKSAKKSEK